MSSQVVFLIPGNPGDAYYYRGFAARLQARGHEVVVFDHARLRQPPESMLPYAEHQARQMREYIKQSGRDLADAEVVLVGHSVGGYIAHLIDVHRLLPVARAVLLFPFLAEPSPRALVHLTAFRYFGRLCVWLLARTPRAWLRAWIACAGLTAHCEHLVETLTAKAARSYPIMGATEHREIARRVDAGYLVRDSSLVRRGRLSCIFAEGDRWSPARAHPGLDSLSETLPAHVPHAFVLAPESWDLVASAVEARLAMH